ncbi:MAG: L-histidine N(alpha)-methyltransferase [Deltaproteobacteria bacterium]|nr:L-histidine N(alpha)-methyltransferase [Deltaproteobacteria bacterium]
MAKKGPAQRSQLVDLVLHTAAALGVESDRELAALAGVSVDNIDNWKSGATQELKVQTLAAIKDGLARRVLALKEQARAVDDAHDAGLLALEIEEGSGPAALQRQFHDRVTYDYLGHRFLYFDSQGALAWENLMRAGYDQGCWLAGVEVCAKKLVDDGIIDKKRGLDLISLGPGEAAKEALIAARVAALGLPWLAVALVDVSIPLLVSGTKACRKKASQVLPFCADFEEGPLSFLRRLPTAHHDGTRLVVMLGNVFGNVRDEEALVTERLSAMLRPNDLLWLEVALRLEKVEDDPLFRMTLPAQGELTAPEANRRLLLEGPYRRWEAAHGRRPSDVHTRVWVRENDETARVPGSLNFCHDLVFEEQRRACTMLYSRRYDVAALGRWLEGLGYAVEAVVPVPDSQKRTRVAHLVARRR